MNPDSNFDNQQSNQNISQQFGLPKQFVDSMRTLFDIMMEDNKTGTIKYSDIEKRWNSSEKTVPILDCLKNVSNNGLLTFDRFCAGLKICLLKHESDKSDKVINKFNLQGNNSDPPPKPPRLAQMMFNNEFNGGPTNSSSKRREPRRHTLQNGIDYNRLKRLKQLEQKKSFLIEGLSAVNYSQRWLTSQIEEVQDQIRQVGRGMSIENSQNYQEDLELQRARVSEVVIQLSRLTGQNRNLNDLKFQGFTSKSSL